MKRERRYSSINFATTSILALPQPRRIVKYVSDILCYVTKVHQTCMMAHGCSVGGTRMWHTHLST